MTARLPRKRPGQYHHGDLRRALIEAALQLIEREGVAAVTTRALARRLGVSHAAPAHHFRDRKALLAEVATEGFRSFANALEEAAAGQADPKERLVAIGRAYVRFACAHPSHLQVMFGRALEEGDELPDTLRAEGERAYRALTNVVEALIASRPGPHPPTGELAFDYWSLVHGMAMLWIDGQVQRVIASPEALEDTAERAVRRTLAGFGAAGK